MRVMRIMPYDVLLFTKHFLYLLAQPSQQPIKAGCHPQVSRQVQEVTSFAPSRSWEIAKRPFLAPVG